MDEHALVVNVDVVVTRGDEYLVVERSAEEDHAAGLLAFPGGKVEADAGEDAAGPSQSDEPSAVADDAVESTARREVKEEVGVDVGDVEYVSSHTFVADDGTPCLNVVTRAEYASGEPTVREPEEMADVFWATLDELEASENAPEFTLSFARQVRDERTGDY